MAKKPKRAPSGPSNAYLMSFGDTMTTLLAFFIVLNSLAEDQTGANLYHGTGSFVRAINSFGLTGHLVGDGGQNAAKMSHTHPHYMVAPEDEDVPFDQESLGPDEDANNLRVIDRELEDFQRFIHEVERVSSVSTLPDTQAEVMFDFSDALNKTKPLLPASYDTALTDILPMLYRPNCGVEVIVWATSPAASARGRASLQAAAIAEELAQKASLDARGRAKLSSVGRPWHHQDRDRPVLSLRVIRQATH